MRFFEDTCFFHSCGCMVHFECLGKRDYNMLTGSFTCPKCRKQKTAYIQAEKVGSTRPRNISRQESFHLRTPTILCKIRTSKLSDEDKVVMASAHREDQVHTKRKQNSEIIEDIHIVSHKRGIQALEIVHEYFDL